MDVLDYYNEDHLLDYDDSAAMRCINKKRNIYVTEVRDNALKHGSNIQAYDEYVNFIAYLVKCLGMPKNVLNISMILNIITKIGIFSDGCEIVLNKNPDNDLAGFLGINVMRGNAVCRNISWFQSDVLKKLGLISEPFYCYLSKDKIDNPQDKEGNHVINLIEYKDNLYGYDALNGGLFKFVSDRELKEMFTDKVHYVYYKPYMDIMISGMDAGNTISMMQLFDIIKDKETITEKEYNKLKENAINAVSKNISLLNDFHESSKKYIKRITKNL